MGTVSTTLPSDGQTIDAADVNTPINAILSEFNGNIDNDNIKSGAAISGSKIADASITNAKLSTTAGELGGAWQSWTPTYSNLTVGNGTVVAKYTQIGKTVHLYWKFTLGSTSSIGTAPEIVLPVSQATADMRINSTGKVADASPSAESSAFFRNNTSDATKARLAYYTSTGVAQNMTATAPITFTTSDIIEITGTYESV